MTNPIATRNATEVGYTVEARADIPTVLGRQIIDTNWRQVAFNDNTPIGVPPRGRGGYHGLAMFELYSYEAAQALRWWMLAQAEFSLIETRIVMHTVEYSAKLHRNGPLDAIGALRRAPVPEKVIE